MTLERSVDRVENRSQLLPGRTREVPDREAPIRGPAVEELGVGPEFALLGQVDERRYARGPEPLETHPRPACILVTRVFAGQQRARPHPVRTRNRHLHSANSTKRQSAFASR